MNKKFLSVILFSALMVGTAGTFTSCKDYDDDIENLQGQIDKLATKEDMTSQIAALQAALDAAKTEAVAAKTSAEEAVKKANDAASTATEAEKAAAQAALDAANAKTEAIKAAQDEVAKVKAELESTIDSKFESAKKEFAATIAELTEKVTKLTGLTTEMITSLDLQTVNPSLALNYVKMPAKFTPINKAVDSYEFGKGFTGSFTITGGEIYTTPSEFLVSVAPVNAVVTNEMFSLINSKGEALNDITITTEPYDGLLTTTRSAANGLYNVKVELNKEADLDAFGKKVAENKNQKVLFALAATKDERTVTSTYDITAESAKKDYFAATGIAEKSTIKSSIEEEKALKDYFFTSTDGKPSDNLQKCYPVVNNEAFQINVSSTDWPTTSPIMASYVVVNIDNEALSTTDKAAIKGLKIEGVEIVSKDNKFDITISGDYAKGVVVPLEVVTIDFTGKQQSVIVWVKAGNESTIEQTASYVVTPTEYIATPTTYNYTGKAKFTVPADAAEFDLSIYTKDEININVSKANIWNNNTFSFFKADGKTKATEIKDIAIAQLNAEINLQTMVNDKVYEGSVKFFDKEGTFLSQSTIKIQKVLPTTLPEGFSVKTNQVSNGIYNCYLIPSSWTATEQKTTTGTMEMSQVFNFGGKDAHYIVTFDAAAWDAANKKDVENKVYGNSYVTVANKYVNNQTEHATSVVYEYGQISSVKENGKFVNHTVNATTFKTIFNCIYNDTYTWRWAKHSDLNLPEKDKDGNPIALPYKTTLTYGNSGQEVEAKYLLGRSTWDSAYNSNLANFYKSGNDVSLAIKTIHLVSDANKEVDEYFKVTLEDGKLKFDPTQTSSQTNPTAPVASTLKVTVYDMYGHVFDITVPMTVNKR